MVEAQSSHMSSDIIIVGGGMVGLTLACALAQQSSLSILVLEAQKPPAVWLPEQYHHRVSAIALSSQRIFQAIGVWPAIQQKRVSPFTAIHVWDDVTKAAIDFSADEVVETNLGYIIENNVIQTALAEKAVSYPQITCLAPIRLTAFAETQHGVCITSDDGRVFSAKLAVAADGAHSWLRQQAGIELEKYSYEQEAIVATVQTAFPHQQCARQVFLKTGPLAFLPLLESNTSSIVWSLPPDEANRLLMLEAEPFKEALSAAFSYRLDKVESVDARHVFPLQKQQAKQYVKSRVVLAGDAAHTVHPLAGQGVNMGLLDAASLADIIIQAQRDGRHDVPANYLRRYERWRKADNLGMLAGVDVIKKLFASEKRSVQILRSAGLTLTQRWRGIKNMFTRHAVGNREGLPSLAKR